MKKTGVDKTLPTGDALRELLFYASEDSRRTISSEKLGRIIERSEPRVFSSLRELGLKNRFGFDSDDCLFCNRSVDQHNGCDLTCPPHLEFMKDDTQILEVGFHYIHNNALRGVVRRRTFVGVLKISQAIHDSSSSGTEAWSSHQ